MHLSTAQFFQQREGISHWRDQTGDAGHLNPLLWVELNGTVWQTAVSERLPHKNGFKCVQKCSDSPNQPEKGQDYHQSVYPQLNTEGYTTDTRTNASKLPTTCRLEIQSQFLGIQAMKFRSRPLSRNTEGKNSYSCKDRTQLG